MAAMKEEIRNWLQVARDSQATHMLVVCDTFDHTDYPVYISPEQDVVVEANERHGVNMQRIMECYDVAMDWDEQLAEYRAWHGWQPGVFSKPKRNPND